MAVVGVDWCRGGWLAVRIESYDARTASTRVVSNAGSLLDAWGDASLILIDIPIGLPDAERPTRSADRMARRKLSPLRHNSVFPTPSRAAIERWRAGRDAEFEDLSEANRREVGKGLSKQSAAIVPTIA